MVAVTVTTKGRVTLSKELLEHLGVSPGDEISVEKMPDRAIRMRALGRSGKISDAFGCLKREGQRSISIEDMNEIIRKGWAGEL